MSTTPSGVIGARGAHEHVLSPTRPSRNGIDVEIPASAFWRTPVGVAGQGAGAHSHVEDGAQMKHILKPPQCSPGEFAWRAVASRPDTATLARLADQLDEIVATESSEQAKAQCLRRWSVPGSNR